jgi:hypothetical protein
MKYYKTTPLLMLHPSLPTGAPHNKPSYKTF